MCFLKALSRQAVTVLYSETWPQFAPACQLFLLLLWEFRYNFLNKKICTCADQPDKMVGLIFAAKFKAMNTCRGNEASNSIHEVLMCHSNTQLHSRVASDYIRCTVHWLLLFFFIIHKLYYNFQTTMRSKCIALTSLQFITSQFIVYNVNIRGKTEQLNRVQFLLIHISKLPPAD